jgi:hypothetical protein
MNKIHQTFQMLVRCTSTHTYVRYLDPFLDQLHQFGKVTVYFYLCLKVLPCPAHPEELNFVA